jgi:DNA polymerase-3 subunit delta'
MVRAAFADLLGQETAIALLCRAVEQARLAPAYLFVGPAGVGRRFAALRFAEILLAARDPNAQGATRRRIEQRNHPDLLWVEPTYLHQGQRLTVSEAIAQDIRRKSPPQIRLEQIRDITRFLSRPPLESSRCVVVIEGAETMAEGAANGLLKTLEEPGQATLVLIAPDTAALLPTLVSRCQAIPFRRLATDEMAAVLQRVGHGEIFAQADVLAMAQGSPGQAIAAWQQCQALPVDLLTAVTQPPKTLRAALDLARWIAKDLDTEAQLWLVDYLQHRHWHQHHSPAYLEALETARQHLRRFVQPRLVWEVTLMGMVGE